MSMKNIYVKLYGGLGNQLFQYAFGKSLSKKLSVNLIFEVESGFKNDFFKRKYVIKDLVNNPLTLSSSNSINRLTISTSIIGKLYRKFNRYLPKNCRFYYRERKKFLFDSQVFKIKKDSFFDGYWQNHNYFKDIVDELRDEIQQVNENKNIKIIELLNKQNSVAVHMRYPHAFANGKVHKQTEEHFHSLDFNYFKTAIYKMKSLIHNPDFYLFSDNIEWAKKQINNASLGIKYQFIDSGNAMSDFHLMRQCNHFVISNSTFSWWAAFLANKPSKQVISPKNWIKKVDFVDIDFFPKDWHLINNKSDV